MKATPWNFPRTGARLLLASYALIAVPSFAATTAVARTLTSHSPSISCPRVEYETVRMLTASANGPIQVVAEAADANDGKQLATSLPVTVTPLMDMSPGKRVHRPDFIPACAFTNDEMVAPYHDSETSMATVSTTQELPARIKLDPSVSRHWQGVKNEPCWVNTTPDKDHPGTYSFSSETESGPKGWLQHTGERSAWGHPEYRYWFDPS